MKEQFVTYEIAKKLKELGFNEPCIGAYDEDSEEKYFQLTGYGVGELRQKSDENLGYLIAPLWQQAIDWLRQRDGIHIEFTHGSNSYYGFKIINEYKNNIVFEEKPANTTYPHARKAAILKALELINN